MGRKTKRTFKQELLICFLAVSVLPLAVCSLFLIQLFQMKISRDYQVMDMEQAQEVNGRLERVFGEFETLAQNFSENEMPVKYTGCFTGRQRNCVAIPGLNCIALTAFADILPEPEHIRKNLNHTGESCVRRKRNRGN